MKNLTLILQIVTLGLLLSGKKLGSPSQLARRQKVMVVDTCGLIDGRLVEIAKTGFSPSKLIIPKFVIAELQMLADGRDAHKRERARYGLDVIKQLQEANYCDVEISNEFANSNDTTDHKLVQLASKLGAHLYTTDYNLLKVAEIDGVTVLNVNELAQSLRPTALPGERFKVKILQRGSGSDQGVGYLEDGTMVVVNGAGKQIGKSVEVDINRTFQTVAGKMLFGEMLKTKQTNQTAQPNSAFSAAKTPATQRKFKHKKHSDR